MISLGVFVLVHILMLALQNECDHDRYLFLSPSKASVDIWTRLSSRISNNYRQHVTRSVSISLTFWFLEILRSSSSLLYSMSLMFVASSLAWWAGATFQWLWIGAEEVHDACRVHGGVLNG
jgi:hypothetical protein